MYVRALPLPLLPPLDPMIPDGVLVTMMVRVEAGAVMRAAGRGGTEACVKIA